MTCIKDPILRYERLLRKSEYLKNTQGKYNLIYLFNKLRLRNLPYKLGFSISENVFGPKIEYCTLRVHYCKSVLYACSTYKSRSKTACTMHGIKHNRLEAAVLFAIQQQVHLAVSYSAIIARINSAPLKKASSPGSMT